jgi:hypothetical protein
VQEEGVRRNPGFLAHKGEGWEPEGKAASPHDQENRGGEDDEEDQDDDDPPVQVLLHRGAPDPRRRRRSPDSTLQAV